MLKKKERRKERTKEKRKERRKEKRKRKREERRNGRENEKESKILPNNITSLYNKPPTTTVKTSLKNILKPTKYVGGFDINRIIQNHVRYINNITTHTYFFLKLMLIYYIEMNLEFPKIDDDFIVCIMKSITEKVKGGGVRPSIETINTNNKIIDFYDKCYRQLIPDGEIRIESTNLSQFFKYESTTITTCIKNNIISQFSNRLSQYINLKLDIENKLNNIKNNKEYNQEHKDVLKKSIIKTCRDVKNDIFNKDKLMESLIS